MRSLVRALSKLWQRAKTVRHARRLAAFALVSGTIVISGLFTLRGVTRLLDRKATPSERRYVSPLALASDSLAAPAREVAEDVLKRNIFDSQTGTLAWEESTQRVAATQETRAEASEPAATVCPDNVRLLASIVSSSLARGTARFDSSLGRASQRSFAAVRKDGKLHLVGVGDRLGELTLVALYPTRAFFQNEAAARCVLPVFASGGAPAQALPVATPVVEAPPPAPTAETPDAVALARRPPAFSEEELKRNIRVLGPSRYAVSKELFVRARSNPSGISRGARFQAHVEDGKAMGMKVTKIRDDSLLSHLGVQQGDVLRGLNGFNFGSADGVLEAFGHLGKIESMSLSVMRNGVPQVLRYELE